MLFCSNANPSYKGADKLRNLTPIQKKIYYIIKDFIDQKGYSPSYREIGKLNGTNSTATIHYHMKNLRKKGYIDYQDKINRSVRIIK